MKSYSKENDPEFTRLHLKAGTVSAAIILLGFVASILGFVFILKA